MFQGYSEISIYSRMIDYPVYLFDIDGTLNEPQKPMEDSMRCRLQRLAHRALVYFVTGNGYVKSVDILNGSIRMYSGIFLHNADELRTMRGKLIWRDEEAPALPAGIEGAIRTIYECTAPNSIEWRSPRFMNFSKIGRFATQEQRDSHDASWRVGAADFIRKAFPGVETAIGGAISVDVYSAGADKARACRYLNKMGRNFIFVGDKTDIGGNDHPVAEYCRRNPENICIKSIGVNDTISILEEMLRRS